MMLAIGYNVYQDTHKTKYEKFTQDDGDKCQAGTLNLVWNDFMDDVVKGPVEFTDGKCKLAEELNKRNFTEDQISEKSIYKIHGPATSELKHKIEKDVKDKFNEKSDILDELDWDNSKKNEQVFYCMLKKEFTYNKKFPVLKDESFNNSREKVKYFGIDSTTKRDAEENVDVLFYNSENDYAVKLKTKQGDEVILYKSKAQGKSFEDSYNEILNLSWITKVEK